VSLAVKALRDTSTTHEKPSFSSSDAERARPVPQFDVRRVAFTTNLRHDVKTKTEKKTWRWQYQSLLQTPQFRIRKFGLVFSNQTLTFTSPAGRGFDHS